MSNTIVALREKPTEKTKDAFLKITEKHGHITPEFVLQAAKNPKSILHEYFCWDDQEAGHEYRLMQARFLIRSVKLDIVRTVSTTPKEVTFETTRAFVSPPSIRGEKSYIRLKVAMEDAELRKEMLDRAKIELKGLKERYKQLSELAEVWDVIEMI